MAVQARTGSHLPDQRPTSTQPTGNDPAAYLETSKRKNPDIIAFLKPTNGNVQNA
jgi:hypothetical protein